MGKYLDALHRVGWHISSTALGEYFTIEEDFPEEFATIEVAVKGYEKEHEAFEIIKKKRVDTLLLKMSDNLEQYHEYMDSHGKYSYFKLTQEEYALLKEVLN